MTALVIADAVLEKFGGDSVDEVQRNMATYRATLPQLGTGSSSGGDGDPLQAPAGFDETLSR